MASHRPPRIVAAHRGTRPGPTVVVSGGVHGNEPAGVLAARRVVEAVVEHGLPLAGRILAVAGNIAALGERRRYLVRDLNRRWDPSMLAALDGPADALTAEDREQRELYDLFVELEGEGGPLVFLDLHTTSGESPPFICMADTLANRTIAFALPIPVILGLEEVIDGSMLGYLVDRGHLGVAIEGGQHDDPVSVDRHAGAIWLVLVAAGCLDRADVPDFDAVYTTVSDATRSLPPVVEIRHRQVTAEGDGFVMEPGWKSFQPVEAGTLLARDAAGEIHAPEAGLLLMPRYQPQGDDGFFVIREVRPFWLSVSAALRRLGLDRLVPLLPGVRRDPGVPDRLLVGEGWMPPQVVNVMHLFGYRRQQAAGEVYVFSRRREPG